MQAMLVYPVSPTRGIPGNHCTTCLEIWLSSQSWQTSLLGVSARWREEASRAAVNTRDTALILLVVLQFKRQKWLQLKNVL